MAFFLGVFGMDLILAGVFPLAPGFRVAVSRVDSSGLRVGRGGLPVRAGGDARPLVPRRVGFERKPNTFSVPASGGLEPAGLVWWFRFGLVVLDWFRAGSGRFCSWLRTSGLVVQGRFPILCKLQLSSKWWIRLVVWIGSGVDSHSPQGFKSSNHTSKPPIKGETEAQVPIPLSQARFFWGGFLFKLGKRKPTGNQPSWQYVGTSCDELFTRVRNTLNEIQPCEAWFL